MRKATLLLLAAALAGLAGELRVGTAALKITPPLGAPMAGYYYNRGAEGVHDELYAKALVFEQDGARAALVACDLISMPGPIARRARKLIEQAAGIPPERVMISSTHAHTGPVLVAGGSRYNLEGRMAELAREYAEALPARIAEAVKMAGGNLRAATGSAAVGREETLTFCRRFHMKDGKVAWNPGKRNPNILRPAGPIDPSVPVIYFETPQGEPVATYVNYALHLDTVGGLHYSADYPYTLATLLGKLKGPGMLTMFTIGCAGNLNHIDVKSAEPQKGHGEAARIGTVLAGEVLRASARLRPVTAGPLRGRSRMVNLPLPAVTAEDVQWAARITPKFGARDAAPFMDLVRAFKIADVDARKGRPLEAEVQVISLGRDVAWVALPGEIFTELGMAIKKASPFPYTVVVELANDSLGYIPNRESYPEGAYEVESARCAAGSGEMLVEAALALLGELHGQPPR